MYWVAASAYSLLICGDRAKAGACDEAAAGSRVVWSSRRREGALTGKRGEGAQEELEVRREAW